MKRLKVFSIILGFVIVLLFAGIGYAVYLNFKSETVGQVILQGKLVQYLWSFEFKDKNDDISVVSFLVLQSSKTKNFAILEIPPYLGKYDKEFNGIVPLYYYYKKYGADYYRESIRQLLRADSLLYFYVAHDKTQSFVDIIGGLEIPLAGDLINFDVVAGEVALESYYTIFDKQIYLDGQDTSTFLQDTESRLRNDVANTYSVSAGRKAFILALYNTLQKEHAIFEQDAYLDRIRLMTESNVSKENTRSLLLSIGNFNELNTFFQQIQGNIETVTIEDENYGIVFPSSNDAMDLYEIAILLTEKLEQEKIDTTKDLSMTILNGTVVRGLAKKTKEIYEEAGFTVLGIGNASDDNIQTTVVIDRTGNKTAAKKVADIIGAQSIITDISILDREGAQITLILGNDFDGKKIK